MLNHSTAGGAQTEYDATTKHNAELRSAAVAARETIQSLIAQVPSRPSAAMPRRPRCLDKAVGRSSWEESR